MLWPLPSTYLLSICWNVDAIAKAFRMSKVFQYKIYLQNDIIVDIFFQSRSFNGSTIRMNVDDDDDVQWGK